MITDNPYKAPKTADPENDTNDGSIISTMESKRLKKLYYRSVNIGTIAVLLSIGIATLVGVYCYLLIEAKAEGGLIIIIKSPTSDVVLAFLIIAVIGLFMRQTWGRILGIIACILMLVTLQIITIIIGIAGLVALFKAPELFGKERLRHKELKKEFKLRKGLKQL